MHNLEFEREPGKRQKNVLSGTGQVLSKIGLKSELGKKVVKNRKRHVFAQSGYLRSGSFQWYMQWDVTRSHLQKPAKLISQNLFNFRKGG